MNYKSLFLLIVAALLLQGCTSYKNSIYMQNSDVLEVLKQKESSYDYRVMPKDELTITITTSDAAASAPFYRKIGQDRSQVNNSQGMNNAKLLDYLVDNEGYIDYPGLGKLQVKGLTTRECEALMRDELQKYLNEVPNVTVRVSNFKVSVLGEVNKPGTFLVTDEQINVFQALALAGDMTLFSRRQDVQLMRADANGKLNTICLDLTDANITASPYFYLQQNDILYVKPTKMKVYSNTFNNNSSMWLGLLSTIASFISLFIIVYY